MHFALFAISKALHLLDLILNPASAQYKEMNTKRRQQWHEKSTNKIENVLCIQLPF